MLAAVKVCGLEKAGVTTSAEEAGYGWTGIRVEESIAFHSSMTPESVPVCACGVCGLC